MKSSRQSGTSIIVRYSWQFLVLIATILISYAAVHAIGTTTTTTLAVTPATPVAAGTVVTLTATVLAGATPVTDGTVTFCNASATHCEDAAIFGTAQLTGAGTAAVKTTLGVGTYSIKAVFRGAGAFLTSTSTAQPFVISAATNLGSATTITATGVAGNYTLVGTVSGFGKPVVTGTVSFLDASNSNAVVATGTLGTGAAGSSFVAASGSPNALGTNVFSGNEVIGDFNNDGFPDIAVVNTQDTSLSTGGTLGILLGKGDGTFQAQVRYAVGTSGSSPNAIAIGDFNGDGKPDLAVVDLAADTLSIFIGRGDGTFLPAVTYATGTTPFTLAVGDFNNDGNLDVAVGNYSDATVGIFLGRGDGTFQTQVPYTVTAGPIWMVAGDFNGDGNTDLAVAYPDTGQLGILLGAGNGTFPPDVPYTIGTAGTGPFSIAAGDFNGDGVTDLVVNSEPVAGPPANGSLGVLLGNANGTFQAPVFYAVGPNPTGLAVADFNGDGKLDILTTNEAAASSAGLSVLLGNGNGTFQTQTTSGAGDTPFAVGVGDFNRDGLPDVAVINALANGTASIVLDQYSETATATNVAVYPVGTHNVLASYPGDATHATSQSATTALTGIAVPYSISGPTTPLVIPQGGSGTVTITVSPVGGPFNSPVTMSATGLPTGATATFVPTTVTPGAGGGTTMLTIQLVPFTAKLTGDHSKFQIASLNLAAFGLCGLLFFGKRSSKAMLIVLISFGLAGATMLAGCSSSRAPDTTPAGNSTVTVTGTNGNSSASTTFTVTVQP